MTPFLQHQYFLHQNLSGGVAAGVGVAVGCGVAVTVGCGVGVIIGSDGAIVVTIGVGVNAVVSSGIEVISAVTSCGNGKNWHPVTNSVHTIITSRSFNFCNMMFTFLIVS